MNHFLKFKLKFLPKLKYILRILIGAPRANSTTPSLREFNETGAIYVCDFQQNCEEIEDKTGASQDTKSADFENKMTSWLGASLDGNENDGDLFVVR